MTDPTRIVQEPEYRNFQIDLERIRVEAKRSYQAYEPPNLKKGDSLVLVLLVQLLVDERLANCDGKDLCPACAGRTWGRPRIEGGSAGDYARRECHVCGWIRGNPVKD